MVKKKRKATHRQISSPVGDGEKKKWLPAGRETEAREKLPVAVPENVLTATKKKEKRTENLQTPNLRKEELAVSTLVVVFLRNFFLWFFTPAAAHLLFGVVHVTIEQRSFVQPRQRLRQILIRTGS